jgi:hypothetical protein
VADTDGQARQRPGQQQRMRDVVAVADVGERPPRQLPEGLTHGQEVGQRLARVLVIGQGVDDRDGRPFGELLEAGLGEGADHDALGT